jgi:class 3 adenylate cyclase
VVDVTQPVGGAATSGAPSGTVTLLFTDVEGSTKLWDTERATMGAALRCHDAILRDAIEHAGGYVFKTAGDSFCAAFSAARAGLDAALAAQRKLAAQAWPTSRPIVVRMGLHVGVCEERDGDYFGPAVNRAARLLTVARGGQVLVSGAAAELLSDEMPAGVGLRELGTHQLKDLSRPERIYQVEAAFLAEQPGVAANQPARQTARQVDRADLATDAAQVPDLARIECHSGSARRDGSWLLPRRMEITVGSGSVRLDFRDAVIVLPELEIDTQIASGSLKLITRPGIVVDTADLTVGSGSVRVVPSADADALVQLRVKVSGRVRSGSVTAEPARGWWRALWRWALRFWPASQNRKGTSIFVDRL